MGDGTGQGQSGTQDRLSYFHGERTTNKRKRLKIHGLTACTSTSKRSRARRPPHATPPPVLVAKTRSIDRGIHESQGLSSAAAAAGQQSGFARGMGCERGFCFNGGAVPSAGESHAAKCPSYPPVTGSSTPAVRPSRKVKVKALKARRQGNGSRRIIGY